MENANRINEIVLLLENYSKEAKQLHTTFKLSGVAVNAIIIDGEGFTPDDVTCVYEDYLNEEQVEEIGEALYFNQIEVPNYWEISGNNLSGSVHNLDKEKAKIYYAEPKNKRIVKIVEWFDEKGTVRVSDHYNKHGRIYARTTFNKKGERVTKSYFSVSGKEIIVENFVTSDIILNYGGKATIFRNKTEFVKNYLIENGYSDSRIFYNSLSYPFFVSQGMPAKHKNDILFWQEKCRNDIPGNMQSILNHTSTRTDKVVVQIKNAYDKFIELGVSEDTVKLLGYIYEYKRSNNYGRDVLICTNSDQIVELENIIKGLPQMHIHIVALTEMSSKLMAMEKYANTSLYPAADEKTIEKLFSKCDYYLDINRYDEIADAVYNAFLNNQVILGFRETLHNSTYIDEDNIFEATDWNQMVNKVLRCAENKMYVDEMLEAQKMKAASIDGNLLERMI